LYGIGDVKHSLFSPQPKEKRGITKTINKTEDKENIKQIEKRAEHGVIC